MLIGWYHQLVSRGPHDPGYDRVPVTLYWDRDPEYGAAHGPHLGDEFESQRERETKAARDEDEAQHEAETRDGRAARRAQDELEAQRERAARGDQIPDSRHTRYTIELREEIDALE